MPKFSFTAGFSPAGGQPEAIRKLAEGVDKGQKHQVLQGVTGSGKTMVVAQMIQEIQRPTLVMSPNKTLAAQLCSEFRSFFPQNAVEYFVLGEKGAELAAKLGGQRLVRRHDERRPLDLLDHLGDDHRLAGAGHALQDLVLLALIDPFGKLPDSLRLAPRRGKPSRKRELWHVLIVGSWLRQLTVV